jgi:hypothetical protein
MMVTANDPRVVAFYTFIQEKPRNTDGHYIGSSQNESGLLYVIDGKEPMIQVWLPRDLLDYANAAAGSSGERPVGIRAKGFSSVDQAADEVVRIFDTPENLARFINSSEADYQQYHAERAQRGRRGPVMANDADQGFWSRYGREEMLKLKATVKDHKQLTGDFQTMTLSDFELKYGLVAAEAAA